MNWISKHLIIHDPDYFNMMYFLNYVKVFTDSGGLKKEVFFRKMTYFLTGKTNLGKYKPQNCSLSVDPLDFKRIKGLINKNLKSKN